MAQARAERFILHGDPERVDRGSDYEKAEQAVGHDGVGAAEVEARRLVDEYWGAIGAVAKELIVRGLEGDEVRKIIEKTEREERA
jgi:hypothetical protein